MKTITNKTKKPLSVPLPRGKTLHIGPGKTGQIASTAAEHPPLKKLIEAGELEVLGEGSGASEGTVGTKTGRTWMPGHASGTPSRRSGDR